ncbi:uncharacterized protein EI90DRAFT_3050447 [Cantharellus anzutake]|uniref:uncharacterized protein n=1 Tax=Cantharellus anzutake TaxID=1750568 RepID=UPI001903CD02|nr:uncharacterized protein EI90DRAFT_3050447 [Cantharellus anzutake]KAF8333964.1 hypothetical protein EI90DRAFT_3050447 [Cantharellus anzutake]
MTFQTDHQVQYFKGCQLNPSLYSSFGPLFTWTGRYPVATLPVVGFLRGISIPLIACSNQNFPLCPHTTKVEVRLRSRIRLRAGTLFDAPLLPFFRGFTHLRALRSTSPTAEDRVIPRAGIFGDVENKSSVTFERATAFVSVDIGKRGREIQGQGIGRGIHGLVDLIKARHNLVLLTCLLCTMSGYGESFNIMVLAS